MSSNLAGRTTNPTTRCPHEPDHSVPGVEMSLLRFILVVLLLVVLRRMWVRARTSVGDRLAEERKRREKQAHDRQHYQDLTDQGIDDADFEEIP